MTSRMTGRRYPDPGDRATGRYDPPRPCRVLARWGPGGGPRNVLIEYAGDGSRAVIPFPRRLRRARPYARSPVASGVSLAVVHGKVTAAVPDGGSP
jgi:hypothetical protein